MTSQQQALTSPAKFYYDLQSSRFREQAFEQWEDYRNSITDLLLSSCEKGKTLAIFGAGRCNDIDLSRLSEHFSQITLIDINDASMYSALWRYDLSQHPNVKMVIKDFVGIIDEDYIKYVYALLREHKEYKLFHQKNFTNASNSKALKQLDAMYKKARAHDLDLGQKLYDYSLTLNVHSQLNDTADWIRTKLMSMLDADTEYNRMISRKINQETKGIIKKFNDAILAATKIRAFIGYERWVLGHGGRGVQGAIQAYADLREREYRNELKSIRQTHFIWPYDRSQKIEYDIQVETLNLSNIIKDVH